MERKADLTLKEMKSISMATAVRCGESPPAITQSDKRDSDEL